MMKMFEEKGDNASFFSPMNPKPWHHLPQGKDSVENKSVQGEDLDVLEC
jgi:hypothetical protein